MEIFGAGSLLPEGQTEADGRFELLWRAGEPLVGSLAVTAEGFAPTYASLDGTTLIPIRVELGHGCRVEGVVSASGQPASDAGLRIVASWEPLGAACPTVHRRNQSVVPDPSGWFVFEGLPAVLVTVQAERDLRPVGWVQASPPEALELSLGEVSRLDIDLDASDRILDGRVEITGATPGSSANQMVFWISARAVDPTWMPYSGAEATEPAIGGVRAVAGQRWRMPLRAPAGGRIAIALRIATGEQTYIERVLDVPPGESELSISIPVGELVEFAAQPPGASDGVPPELVDQVASKWRELRATPPRLTAVAR
ncbi:carboxypeptidase-like regulatory domain-containing protein [Engelhardtia mirabilis]|uniref:carboxypeptidase-like regulatory domain-containing protein n=1 Tax=Engelhardtia mirabilis TaxID=2528011 RepID=UPI0011A122BF